MHLMPFPVEIHFGIYRKPSLFCSISTPLSIFPRWNLYSWSRSIARLAFQYSALTRAKTETIYTRLWNAKTAALWGKLASPFVREDCEWKEAKATLADLSLLSNALAIAGIISGWGRSTNGGLVRVSPLGGFRRRSNPNVWDVFKNFVKG